MTSLSFDDRAGTNGLRRTVSLSLSFKLRLLRSNRCCSMNRIEVNDIPLRCALLPSIYTRRLPRVPSCEGATFNERKDLACGRCTRGSCTRGSRVSRAEVYRHAQAQTSCSYQHLQPSHPLSPPSHHLLISAHKHRNTQPSTPTTHHQTLTGKC